MKINNVKKLRKAAGMRQWEVAEKLNVSQSTISKYESGASKIDTQVAWKLAELFNVPVNEIYGPEIVTPVLPISEDEPYVLTEEDREDLIKMIEEFFDSLKK